MDYNQLSHLVELAKKGKFEAYEKIYSALYKLVYYTVYRITKNDQDTDDVVQETFTKLFINLKTLNNSRAVISYVNKIAYHTALTTIDKSHKNILIDEFADNELEPLEQNTSFLPAEYLESAEKRTHVLEAIDDLNEIQRMTILMFYYEELSIKQIAEIMKTNEDTVSKRLSRARAALKGKLIRYQLMGGVFAFMNKDILTRILQDDAEKFLSERAATQAHNWTQLQGTLSEIGVMEAVGPIGNIQSLAGNATTLAPILRPVAAAIAVAVIAGAGVFVLKDTPKPIEDILSAITDIQTPLAGATGENDSVIIPASPPRDGMSITAPPTVIPNDTPTGGGPTLSGESDIPPLSGDGESATPDSPDNPDTGQKPDEPWISTTDLPVTLEHTVLTYHAGEHPTTETIIAQLGVTAEIEIAEIRLGMLDKIDFDRAGDYGIHIYVTAMSGERLPARAAFIQIID